MVSLKLLGDTFATRYIYILYQMYIDATGSSSEEHYKFILQSISDWYGSKKVNVDLPGCTLSFR